MRRVSMLAFVALCACGPDHDPPFSPDGEDFSEREGFLPEGPVVSAAVAPAPISGGTLLVMRDGFTAVAADPDRDRVYVVNLAMARLEYIVELEPGSEPGRLVEDASGEVHVVLRRAGAIASIQPFTGMVTQVRPVCPAPRGIAYDEALDLLHVACETGELVSIDPALAEPERVLMLGRDLRDVVVDGPRLLVSRFRSASVLVILPDGSVLREIRLPSSPDFAPAVAWRMQSVPFGGALLLHQRGFTGEVAMAPDGYGGFEVGCGGIVQTVATIVDAASSPIVAPALMDGTLVTDMAVAPDGRTVVFAATGNSWDSIGLPEVFVVGNPWNGDCRTADNYFDSPGEVVAVAYDGDGRIIVQSREPAYIEILQGHRIELGGESRLDTGLALFHLNPGTGIACASCHPEGRDDGRVWSFFEVGPRRTQSLAAALSLSAPYHWSGAFADLDALTFDVFEHRMGSGPLDDAQRRAFVSWLLADRTPIAASVDPAAAARGELQYNALGCAGCHGGLALTNNQTADVGTGIAVQVPSLVGVGGRAPYLHNGCARTLRERFGPCGGGDAHGQTLQLTPTELDDLVAYLETL